MSGYTRNLTLRTFNESDRDELKDSIDYMRTYLDNNGLWEIIDSLLNELIANAVKANLKRVFFIKEGINYLEPTSYREGLKVFKKSYNAIARDTDYYDELKKLDLSTLIEFDLNNERLLIYVKNNSNLLEQEEQRIREKLAGAMHVKDLIQYSKTHADEMEGKGLGLAMIVILIKHLGYNPENFRVYSENERTIARLEFPLTEDYIPIRDTEK